MATKAWCDLFTTYVVSHISTIVSDHLPIILEIEKKVSSKRQRRQNKFRLESIWAKELECEEIIISTWNERSTASFFDKIKSTRSHLCRWHTTKFCGMRNSINKLSHALEQIQSLPIDDYTIIREKEIKEKLNDLLQKEEDYWF